MQLPDSLVVRKRDEECVRPRVSEDRNLGVTQCTEKKTAEGKSAPKEIQGK